MDGHAIIFLLFLCNKRRYTIRKVKILYMWLLKDLRNKNKGNIEKIPEDQIIVNCCKYNSHMSFICYTSISMRHCITSFIKKITPMNSNFKLIIFTARFLKHEKRSQGQSVSRINTLFISTFFPINNQQVTN